MTAPQATAASASSNAQAAQVGLALVLEREVAAAWPALDVDRLKATKPNLIALLVHLINRYGSASATMAVRFYQQQRQAAGIAGRFTVRPADPPPLAQVKATVDWATSDMWGTDPDVQAALTKLTGAVETLVLDQGRDTIIGATHADRKAKGWARVPEPDACYFCAMLATRGAVYKHGTATFQPHDHCRCHAEPVFNSYEPSAQIREWQSLYANSTKGVYGMRNQQNAFRRAYEGR